MATTIIDVKPNQKNESLNIDKKSKADKTEKSKILDSTSSMPSLPPIKQLYDTPKSMFSKLKYSYFL